MVLGLSPLPSNTAFSQYIHQPAHGFLFDLPIELRNNIYRYIVISRLDVRSHPRLWRPLGVDGGSFRIGYFDRDTVIPLLLTSRQIHNEASTILYAENTFAFHISGLAAGPISFLEWLSPRYVRLLRRVYIRTGCNVDSYGVESRFAFEDRRNVEPAVEKSPLRAARELAVSVALMKQAWPVRYEVIINKNNTVSYPAEDSARFLSRDNACDWPASSFHLWKMCVKTEAEVGESRIEFRRVERDCADMGSLYGGEMARDAEV